MQYPFPDEFPERSRRTLLAAEIQGARDLQGKNEGSAAKLKDLLIGFILHVFIVFVREASELVHQGIWNVGRLESESLQFLHYFAVTARSERGYDKHGHQIGELVSHWATLLPEVERAFRQSPQWLEYEHILLEAVAAPTTGIAGQLRRQHVWEGIEIVFISDDRVQVNDGTQVQTFNYHEMGFEDRRSGKPIEGWGMLRAIAKAGGFIPNSARDAQDFIGMGKRIERLRQGLKKHFQITAEPLLKDATGYRCLFKIGIAPSFDT
jgi:hypothetical protein